VLRRSLAVLVAAAAVAAGCGPASTASKATPPTTTVARSDSQTAIAASAAATQEAGSARVDMRMRLTGLPQAGEVSGTGSGVIAFADRRAQLAFRMSLPQAGMTLDMVERMVGPVLYIRSPMYAALNHGKPWIKLDLERAGRAQGLDLNALMNSQSSDPAQMLSYLEASSDSITRVGSGVVHGVTATHYHVVVDLAKAARNAPFSARPAVRRAVMRAAAMLGIRTLPVDVWIDADGLVRRESLRMPLRAPSLPAGLAMSFTMDLYDFGVPVHVTAPPASQVEDITALAASGSSLSG
jgi:hypothetical protein